MTDDERQALEWRIQVATAITNATMAAEATPMDRLASAVLFMAVELRELADAVKNKSA